MLLLEIVFSPFGEFNELLSIVGASDRNHQPSANLELLLECRRYPLSSSGDQDNVEPLVVGPPERSVALAKLDVGIAEFPDPLRGLCEERSMSFDRAYLPSELGRDGCGVTRSSPDFEHAIVLADLRSFQHESTDVRLRNGLLFRDGKRTILVSELLEPNIHKRFPRNLTHRRQHPSIADAAAGDLHVNHAASSVTDACR